MAEIFFLKPLLVYEMWGSDNLKDFNIDLSGANDVGEAYLICGNKNKSTIILNGTYKNKSLYEVFHTHKELFDNYESNKYPLMVKVLDVNQNLSVQVHPTAEIAKKYNDIASTKCWYILKSKPESQVICGHNAKTKEELKEMIQNDQWEKLLAYKPVKTGDVLYVPDGCVHAINEGNVVYTVQEPTDVVFKLYSYNRDLFDAESYKLNVDEAIETINCPHTEAKFLYDGPVLFDNGKYKIVKIVNKQKLIHHFQDARWIQATVIDGRAKLEGLYEISKGNSFVIASDTKSFELDGDITLLVSYIKK